MLDDDTKRLVCQLSEEIARLQRAKEESVARMDFDEAAQLWDRERENRDELAKLDLPQWVRKNAVRRAEGVPHRHYPVLDMFQGEAGEPDERVLSLLPNPMTPPVKIAVGIVPQFPVSTLKVRLAADDIGSPYFQVLVPLISPESVVRFGNKIQEALQAAFREIERAATATRGCPILLVLVRPTALPQEVLTEVLAGIQRTDCEFVLFETQDDLRAVLSRLRSDTTLLEP